MSIDSIEESRTLAAKVGIAFPLLHDDHAAVARALTGIDDNDLPIPGVVVVARGGDIVFRQVAHSKADRLSTADLLAVIDQRQVGHPPGRATAVDLSFAASHRLQLAADLTTGIGKGPHLATGTTVSTLYPVTRRFLLGGEAAVASNPLVANVAISLGAKATLRLPFWNDLAAWHVSVSGGPDLWSHGIDSTYFSKAAVQVWFAVRPQWAIQAGLVLDTHWSGATNVSRDASLAVGLAHLFAL